MVGTEGGGVGGGLVDQLTGEFLSLLRKKKGCPTGNPQKHQKLFIK